MLDSCNCCLVAGSRRGAWTRAVLISSTALLVVMPDAAAAQVASEATVPDAAAAGQPTRNGADDEIVISAKRLGASVDTLPVAVTVIGATEIAKLGITNTADLQNRVPSLVASTELGIPKVFIRGIGQESNTSGQEPGVATNVDGVYVGRAVQAYATEIDLERVEVLRGPQGTLYGRNATAGTINYYTKRATSDFAAGANVGGGNLGAYKLGGFVNGQIANGLNARIAVGYSSRDGYVKNLADGKHLDSYDVGAIHAAVNAKPLPNLEFNLSLEAQKDKSNGPSFLNINAPNPFLLPGGVEGRDFVVSNGRWVTLEGPLGEKLFTKRSGEAATLTTDWTPGDVRVRSVTAYRHSEHRQQNADATILPIINTAVHITGDQFSEEVNVSGDLGPASYVVGAIYYHEIANETDRGVSGYPAPALTGISGINYTLHQITDSYAGFGDATIKVIDRIRLLAGLRYTRDDKTVQQENYFDFPFGRIDSCGTLAGQVQASDATPARVQNSVSFSKLTGRVGVEADVADHALAFGTVSRGYKAGGFSDFAGCGASFKPETVDSYEVGFKGSAFDRGLTYRAAGFWMDYSNLQTQFSTISGVRTINAKAARIKGLELEITAHPSDRFSLDANGSFLDAKYRDFLYTYTSGPAGLTPVQLAGDRMPRAPRWSGGVGAEYAQPLANGSTVTARLEGYFTTNYSFNPAAYNPNGSRFQIQRGYALGNAYLTYSSGQEGRWTVRGFVKNFTNRFYLTSALEYSILGNVAGFAAPPRTFGVEVSTRF